MITRRARTIAANDLGLLRRDPAPYIVLTAMPVLMMAFLKPAYRLVLEAIDGPHANGAEQAVPGMAIMFGSLLVANVGFGFFREHGWGTWDRLRVHGARPIDLVIGKLALPTVMIVVQQAVLFGVGVALFDLQVRGSFLALVLTILVLAVLLSSLAVALVSLTRSVMQFNALASLLAFLLAGVGGALTPTDIFPDLVQVVSKATPTYWLMEAFRAVLLDGEGLGSAVLGPLLVALGFAAGFALVAAARFDADDTKTAWA